MPSRERARSLVFTVEADVVPQLESWMRWVDERVATEQVRTGLFFDGPPLREGVLQVVKDSLEGGDPRPYHGAIGGAYTYSFTPTSLGCVVKVRNSMTGDEIDVTDYEAW